MPPAQKRPWRFEAYEDGYWQVISSCATEKAARENLMANPKSVRQFSRIINFDTREITYQGDKVSLPFPRGASFL